MTLEKSWDRILTVAITVVVTGVLGLIGSALAGGALIGALGGATEADLEAAVEKLRDGEQPAAIVSGAVVAFDLPNGCPSGWQPLPNAAGRYIVGLQPNGVLGSTVGTPLSDRENRAVGKHRHGTNSTGSHRHELDKTRGAGGTHGAAAASDVGTAKTDAAGAHAHTVSPTGAVEGTPAPYLQLLICKKA